jgi:hypothetical protein
MLGEWQGKRPKPKRPPAQENEESEGPEAGLFSVAGFLASCGKVEAIAALEKDLRKRPLELRLQVVSSFGEAKSLSVVGSGGGGLINPGDKKTHDNPKEVRTAIEQLLVAELDDTEERSGMSGSWNGKRFSDPRICDAAGHVLNQLAPDKYAFDLSAPLVGRDRAIIELKNAWRKERGLALLPAPVPKKIDPVPNEKLLPLVDKLLQAPDLERKTIESQIESLGLGALPGILQLLEKATKKEDRAILDRLSRRVACIVDEAVFAESAVRPDDALAAKLKAMKGKPFDPDSFLELMRLSVKNLPKGAFALRFSVDRAGDGTGVTIKVDLLDEARAKKLGRSASISPDANAPKNVPWSWNFNESVNVGRKGLHGGTGAWTHSSWLEEKHADLVDALSIACSAPPSEPIDVRIQLIANWAK